MAASLTPTPKFQAIDANGEPVAGGKLYSYAAGTTTPLLTYTEYTGTTANTNPVILDASGRADVWLLQDVSYKLVLYDALDNLVWTVDNILGVAPITDLLPLSVANGGTGAETEADAPFALKGDNYDIESLNGLTTPLSIAQGGTASNTAAGAPFALKGANTDITSLAAPELGSATATTQAVSDDSTKVATTAFVKDLMAAGAQVWCCFDGTNVGTFAPIAGQGVDDITRNSAGDYTVNLTADIGSTNYGVTVSCAPNPTSNQYYYPSGKPDSGTTVSVITKSGVTTYVLTDVSYVTVVIYA